MTNKPTEPYYVQLGSEDYPMPMRDSDGNPYLMSSKEQVVYVPSWHQAKPVAPGASDTISVQHQVFGNVLRKLPTASMLPLFKQELERRDPNRTDQSTRSYISGLRGSPAVGKSFMYKLLGAITHPRGSFVFDCKGVDMGTLFRELVFDISPAVAETNAIDAKLLRGNQEGSEQGLKPENLHILKSICGDAYHEEMQDGRKTIAIDWTGVQLKNEQGLPPETHDEQERLAKKFQEVLRQVCVSENISASDNIAKIGLVERDGIAIRACDRKSPDYGRPIMLEDPDQAKPGTMRKLDEWIPVLTNAEKTCTVTGAGGRTVTIDRKHFTSSFHVSVTQNQAIAGMGSHQLDSPTMSRLSLLMDTAPDAGKIDWVDRVCQQLTGVSANQLYCAVDEFKQDDKLLKDVLLHYRRMGLNKAQLRDLSTLEAEQLQNIKNATKTIELAEYLGNFFYQFSILVNPKSTYHREHNTNLSPEYEEYLTEKAAEFNLRAVTNLFNSAATVSATAQKKKKPSFRDVIRNNKETEHDGQIQDSHRIDIETRLKDRGDRLEKFVMDLVKKTLIPADAATRGIDEQEAARMYDIAIKLAANCQIGLNRQAGTVAHLYNLDVSTDPTFRATHQRDLMVEVLKNQNPGLKLPKDTEKVISAANAERAIQALEDIALPVPSQSTTWGFALNTNPDSFELTPFKPVMLQDTIPETEGETKAFHVSAKDLVPRDALLTALTVPSLAQKIMPGLWNKALTVLIGDAKGEYAAMAQNLPGCDFAVTSLMMQVEGKSQPMHIIRDKRHEQLIIVGGAIDDKLSKLLKSNNATYIDYTSKGAVSQIDQAVTEMLKTHPKAQDIIGNLKTAFLLRNGNDDECDKNHKRSLGDLMSKPKEIQPSIPIYVTYIDDIESLKHVKNELSKPTSKKGKS